VHLIPEPERAGQKLSLKLKYIKRNYQQNPGQNRFSVGAFSSVPRETVSPGHLTVYPGLLAGYLMQHMEDSLFWS